MSLDIALPAPASPPSASGGPPGAGPPTPDAAGQAFAALLAQHGPPPAERAPAKNIATADDTRDEKARSAQRDKNAAPDGQDGPDSSGLSPGSTPALPTSAVLQAAALVLPSPPVPPALPVKAAAASTDSISEAMDTSPALAPALSSGAVRPSGGELLPQTQLNTASAAAFVPAPTSPPAALPSPAPLVSADSSPSAVPGNAGSFLAAVAGQSVRAALAGAGAPAALTGGQASVLEVSAKSSQAVPSPQSWGAGEQAGQSAVGAPQGAEMSFQAALTGTDVSPSALQPGTMASPSAPQTQDAGASAPAAAPPAQAVLPSHTPSAQAVVPGSAQATQAAVQGYAPFAQTALQNTGRPANNTSIGGRAPAALGKAAPEKGASALGGSQMPTPQPVAADHAAASAKQEEQAGQGQTDAEKEKSADASSEAPSEMLMPTSKAAGEPKTAPLFPALQAGSNREALTSQAAQGMQAMHAQAVRSGHGQMTLQLHPQDWGSLQVSVTMTPNASGTGGSNVTAHLVAGSAEVKQALEASGADLKRTLREAGLHLEHFTVSVRPPASSGDAQTMSGGGRGEGRQPRWYDTQTGAAPGSRGDNAAGTMAGNGGTAFGGHGMGAQGQSKERPLAQTTPPASTNQTEEQTARPVPASGSSGRLDTRA